MPHHRSGPNALGATLVLVPLCLMLLAPALAEAQGLPPVPVPPENPITEEKRVLGKILFWEQQLSSDDTVACGTCHGTATAGADDRVGVHPGPDAVFDTADDIFGSPGVVRRDSNGDPVVDALFGLDVQVTGRAAPDFFGGLWAPENFWDGRAGGTFLDPLTGTQLIASGAALENQAIGPILSDVEMAKEGRTWTEVTDKLASATPLFYATDIPQDMEDAVSEFPTYAQLFDEAFGDPAITPARIAFAIATYERTLVADDTPWDAFVGGDTGALTPRQQLGWTFFQASSCNTCHTPPLFTDDTYHTIGVRPPAEDLGRAEVTGLAADDGAFKTPGLRNAALKLTFMHNGEFETLDDVVTFYQPGNQFPQNLDPLIPSIIPPDQRRALLDFLENGLTDDRVAAEAFPFDRPTLLDPTSVPMPGPSIAGLFTILTLGALGRLRRAGLAPRQRRVALPAASAADLRGSPIPCRPRPRVPRPWDGCDRAG